MTVVDLDQAILVEAPCDGGPVKVRVYDGEHRTVMEFTWSRPRRAANVVALLAAVVEDELPGTVETIRVRKRRRAGR